MHRKFDSKTEICGCLLKSIGMRHALAYRNGKAINLVFMKFECRYHSNGCVVYVVVLCCVETENEWKK